MKPNPIDKLFEVIVKSQINYNEMIYKQKGIDNFFKPLMKYDPNDPDLINDEKAFVEYEKKIERDKK